MPKDNNIVLGQIGVGMSWAEKHNFLMNHLVSGTHWTGKRNKGQNIPEFSRIQKIN